MASSTEYLQGGSDAVKSPTGTGHSRNVQHTGNMGLSPSGTARSAFCCHDTMLPHHCDDGADLGHYAGLEGKLG